MLWNDEQLDGAWREYARKFPESDWGYEGCGLTDSEIIELLRKSIETSHDYLTDSFPEYPEGTPYGA